jgi:hypothetical protein
MATTYNGRTADEYKASARECRKRSSDSFDRCDTDGYLSQWAADMTARKHEVESELATQDGWGDFPALFDLQGSLIPARHVKTRYGMAWVEDTDNGPVWYNPSRAKSSERRQEANARKGFYVGRVVARGYVRSEDAGILVHYWVEQNRKADTYYVLDNGQ